MAKHVVVEENARRAWDWLQARGGLAIWWSVNLSNPGASWTAPVRDENGKDYGKPTWQAADIPARIITDPQEVMISIPREVRRFRVAVRMGSQGLSFKLTDASSRKLVKAKERAHAKTGKPSWHVFDYMTQEAVIMVDDQVIPLVDYAREKGWET